MHIIRYDYDSSRDCLPALAELALELRLPERFERIEVISPAGGASGVVEVLSEQEGQYNHRLELMDVPLYCVVVLRRDLI